MTRSLHIPPTARKNAVYGALTVRVKKLFKIAAIDAFYDEARVSIVDAQSGTERVVYSDWPEFSKLLTPVR